MNYQHYERIINPLKIEPCKLLTTRKKQFYTQTYDPIKIIQNIEKYTDDTLDPKIKCEYLKNIKERFNLEIKNNCCNCISFTLYYLTDETKLRDYLVSLKVSVVNITKCLSDSKYNFIARIYLDQSVINLYTEKKDKIHIFEEDARVSQERKDKLEHITRIENEELENEELNNIDLTKEYDKPTISNNLYYEYISSYINKIKLFRNFNNYRLFSFVYFI